MHVFLVGTDERQADLAYLHSEHAVGYNSQLFPTQQALK